MDELGQESSSGGDDGVPQERFQTIYEHTAEALGRMELPDFSGFDEREVHFAFNNVFQLLTLKPSWLSHLQQRVHARSGGGVLVEDVGREGFGIDVKGAAAHLRLVRGDQTRKVLLTPTSRPLTFVE